MGHLFSDDRQAGPGSSGVGVGERRGVGGRSVTVPGFPARDEEARQGMEMLLQKLLASVPTYTRYLTLEQICRQTDALRNQPGFTIETIGQSAKGMPIAMIRYDGCYDRTVLLWGFEDPTEPVGALSMFWLGGQLRWRNPQLMRFQCNWAIIPTINPDGVKRNEGWFRAPGICMHSSTEPGSRPMSRCLESIASVYGDGCVT